MRYCDAVSSCGPNKGAFRLGFLSDFDMDELATTLDGEEGSQEPMYLMVHAWFYLTAFIFSMLMMNILIGILGHNYDKFSEQSHRLSVSKRARVICGLSAMPWYHARIWHGLSSKYLWLAERRYPFTNISYLCCCFVMLRDECIQDPHSGSASSGPGSSRHVNTEQGPG